MTIENSGDGKTPNAAVRFQKDDVGTKRSPAQAAPTTRGISEVDLANAKMRVGIRLLVDRVAESEVSDQSDGRQGYRGYFGHLITEREQLAKSELGCESARYREVDDLIKAIEEAILKLRRRRKRQPLKPGPNSTAI